MRLCSCSRSSTKAQAMHVKWAVYLSLHLMEKYLGCWPCQMRVSWEKFPIPDHIKLGECLIFASMPVSKATCLYRLNARQTSAHNKRQCFSIAGACSLAASLQCFTMMSWSLSTSNIPWTLLQDRRRKFSGHVESGRGELGEVNILVPLFVETTLRCMHLHPG